MFPFLLADVLGRAAYPGDAVEGRQLVQVDRSGAGAHGGGSAARHLTVGLVSVGDPVCGQETVNGPSLAAWVTRNVLRCGPAWSTLGAPGVIVVSWVTGP